tara:strand:- start:894 stop:1421 length:528 start_codon:yes stop_codon:yes gene_type:complete
MTLALRKSTAKERYIKSFKDLSDICKEQGWGSPHCYARGKEIYAALSLGHNVASKLSGADAYDSDGNELEYKSTIQKNCTGAYTGISVKDSWKKQKKYLKEKKIGNYKNHYYNRFEGGIMVESWTISGSKVLKLLTPKIKKSFFSQKNKADPRLSATMTWKQIQKHGTKIKLEVK